MEEEKKEVAVEEVEEVKAPEEKQEGGMSQQSKSALIAFILAVVGFGFACSWFGGIVGTILGIVSLVIGKKNNPETDKQPFKTFGKIAKPVAIVDIILGAVIFFVAILLAILTAVGAIASAANA